MAYNREAAVAYAHQWAYSRNPRYLNFQGIGGDCTNFVSQCLYAGGAVMNYTKTFGWYYISSNNRAPAWTGVQYLYNFLMRKNMTKGPYGKEVDMEEIEPGDIIQLSSGDIFHHTLFVVRAEGKKTADNILIATHSLDSDYRPLSTYDVPIMRFIKIAVR